MLTGRFEIGDEGHMDVQTVILADLVSDLSDRFNKRLALDVADGAADLGDDYVRVGLFADAVDEALDLIRDMRDHLHRLAEILAVTLLIEHIGVDLACREVAVFVQILVDKTLIMTEIEIGLGAVLGHIHLAVLVRAHGTGIDVDIWVELLGGDLQAARFQQSAERGGGDAFAQSRYNASGHKYIFCHTYTFFYECHCEAAKRLWQSQPIIKQGDSHVGKASSE